MRMNKGSIFLITALCLVIVACSKDKFQTRPSLTLKSKSGDVVPVNGGMVFEFDYTDKEGDVSDTLFMRKVRLNRRVVPTLRDSLRYKVPTAPEKTQGEIELRLDYATLISAQNPPTIPGSNPVRREPDTLQFRFVLKDKANNKSDTLVIGPIVVIR
jgi:hypothetical protein